MSSPAADFTLLNDYSCKVRLSHLFYNMVRPECNCAGCRPFGTVYGQSVHKVAVVLPPSAKSMEDIEKVWAVLARTPLSISRVVVFAMWALKLWSGLGAKELAAFLNKNWNGTYLVLPLENGGGLMTFSEKGIRALVTQAVVAFTAAEQEAIRPGLASEHYENLDVIQHGWDVV